MENSKVCFAGRAHIKPLGKSQVFKVAVARIDCVTQRSLHIYVCKEHLDLYLDNADDNPTWEPDKIEWL